MEKTSGVEGETVVLGREGDPYQGSGSSDTDLHNELFQTPSRTLCRYREPH